MKFNRICNSILKEAQGQLPRLGQLVTKAYSEGDDRKEYVVVGTEIGGGHNEAWVYLYPTDTTDYENTTAERVSFPDGLNAIKESGPDLSVLAKSLRPRPTLSVPDEVVNYLIPLVAKHNNLSEEEYLNIMRKQYAKLGPEFNSEEEFRQKVAQTLVKLMGKNAIEQIRSQLKQSK